MKAVIVSSLLALSSAFAPNSVCPTGVSLQLASTANSEPITIDAAEKSGVSVSTDAEYPENFSGRLWFNPSLVRVPKDGPGSDVNVLSIFGYTLGGTVTLEYDTSPVGPYREFVTMSALVMKKGCFGQWGSRLYVSTQEAEDVCKEIWGVPAEVANIDFVEEREMNGVDGTQALHVTVPPNPKKTEDIDIRVEGWKNTRVLVKEDYEYAKGNPNRFGSLPVLWTPTIKALWAPFILFGNSGGDLKNELPLRKLRLSASAIRLHWAGLEKDIKVDEYSEDEYNVGTPLGLGLIVDNVLIEIGTRMENNL
jgi:hypothetical protein